LRILLSRLSGFGGKGIRTPDFQLAKLALYQLSYAPALRIAECRLPICDFKKLFFLRSSFPDSVVSTKENAGPENSRPAFFLVDVQQRLNCALSVVSSSLDFFRYRGLNGISADFSAGLAVDLVRETFEISDLAVFEFLMLRISP
jgi:hypothetical protein